MLSLGILLELEGHIVTTVNNGRDAIRLMTEIWPEVAVVDVGMPDVDGFDVARAVRSDRNLDNMALVQIAGGESVKVSV
ncbi:response regulator [Paraburkholderia sp. FT54]|uniref:response regulator n=1 Tax=Paraburkholderia sp. FT54 TaxID=3074437 RepID=UPI0038F6C439